MLLRSHANHGHLLLRCSLLLLAAVVVANEVQIDELVTQQCSGMFGRQSVGGPTDPFIEVMYVKSERGTVSTVIYEWKDVDYIGVDIDGSGMKQLICDDLAMEKNLCLEKERGQFLIEPSIRNNTRIFILTKLTDLKKPLPMRFDVKHTGYYCVSTLSEDTDQYRAVVEWRNPYGELPAAEYFKLPFYGALSVVYVVIGALWTFQYAQHRSDILPVQNYITALIAFLSMEMIIEWGYYDYVNAHGYMNVGSKFLMVIVSFLNAFRNSFSFFLILIVSMGYSVVRPSLGEVMTRARILALAHFGFGLVYSITSMLVSPEKISLWVLVVIVPLSATMTVLYLWTLSSLQSTIKELDSRKQTTKALMFKRLWRVVIWSISVLVAFIFLNTITFAKRNSQNFLPKHWQDRFVLDGWLNVLYLTVFSTILFIWRPTADNKRFAMSEELSQEEDFELDADLSDEDEERSVPGTLSVPKSPTAASSASANQSSTAVANNIVQSLGANSHSAVDHGQQQLFSVGEDDFDTWSEEEAEHSTEKSKQSNQYPI